MRHHDSRAVCGVCGRQVDRTGDPDRDAGASVAVYLARRPRRSQDARGLVGGAAADRQGRDAGGAVYLQMGDRRPDRRRYRAGAAVELDDVADRIAADHDGELRRVADPDGGVDPMARRHFCPGGDACRAQACLHHLRAHARAVAAVPSGAQDRRVDPRAGARPSRHRSDRPNGDPATGPDHRRGVAADGGAAVEVRLALCAGDDDHRRGVHVLHLHRHRMADRDSPQDE